MGAVGDWDWPVSDNGEQHRERYTLTRPIPYETMVAVSENDPPDVLPSAEQRGKALSINISSGGMLILMDQAINVGQVLKVMVPTPVQSATIPTLAEVRWIRKLPFVVESDLHFVGLKFLF